MGNPKIVEDETSVILKDTVLTAVPAHPERAVVAARKINDSLQRLREAEILQVEIDE